MWFIFGALASPLFNPTKGKLIAAYRISLLPKTSSCIELLLLVSIVYLRLFLLCVSLTVAYVRVSLVAPVRILTKFDTIAAGAN